MAKVHRIVTTDRNERQLEQHGSALFPAGFYYGDLINNFVTWHWHEELEIVKIQRGRIAIGAGNSSVQLEAGNGCFINGNVLHNLWKVDSAPCEYRSIVFHPRLIGSMDSIFWNNCIQPLTRPDFPQFIRFSGREEEGFPAFFSQLWALQEEKNAGYENDIRYILTKFIMNLSATPERQQRQFSQRELRDMERMKTMLAFLQEHLSEELTLEKIAQSAAISETECLRCFRRNIGMSPIHFLKEYRLQHAAGLLRAGAGSISEIAASCGFLDMSYFSRAFRLLYGVTPTAYKKQADRA